MCNLLENEITCNWDKKYTSPMVSIECTVFNHEKYLEHCIDSFLSQKTNFPFEVILHDDASTDNSVKIIEEYYKKYPNIIVPILEKENIYQYGEMKLKNLLIENERGKYIALCEGDDYWVNNNKLQMQFDALEENTDCTICLGISETVTYDEKRLYVFAPNTHSFKEGKFTIEDYMYDEFQKGHISFRTSTYFYRSSLNNGYSCARENEEKYFPHGDKAMLIYFLTQGKGYFIDSLFSNYRKFSGGLNSMAQKDKNLGIGWLKQYKKGLEYFNEQKKFKYDKFIKYKTARIELDIINLENSKEYYNNLFSSKYRFILNEYSFLGKCKMVIKYILNIFHIYK